MSEILLCNQSLSADSFQNQCGLSIDQLLNFNRTKPTTVIANTPYLISSDHFGADLSIPGQLSSSSVAKELTNLSLSYGGDNVVALAEINAKLQELNIGLMGASSSMYVNRIGGFTGSVKDYQGALMEYRQAALSNSPMKTALKQNAHAAFQKMQSQFALELKVVSGQVKARRGTPLTRADRATNIAASSRNVTKLNVSNQIQANNLVKLSRHATFLGNGLAVIDFGGRIGSIHNSYQAGGNWERDLFIESSSFAASAGSGILTANAGAALLGFLIMATPIGWIGLVVGGLAVAGTTAAVSIGANAYTKEKSGEVYDGIMKWVSTL